jgi:hypothetical protein
MILYLKLKKLEEVKVPPAPEATAEEVKDDTFRVLISRCQSYCPFSAH